MSVTPHEGQSPNGHLSFHVQYLCTKHDPQTIVVIVVVREQVYRRCVEVVVLGSLSLL